MRGQPPTEAFDHAGTRRVHQMRVVDRQKNGIFIRDRTQKIQERVAYDRIGWHDGPLAHIGELTGEQCTQHGIRGAAHTPRPCEGQKTAREIRYQPPFDRLRRLTSQRHPMPFAHALGEFKQKARLALSAAPLDYDLGRAAGDHFGPSRE